MSGFFHVRKQKGTDDMEDWKTRLADEYRHTKERYEKLKAYNNKKEVEHNVFGPNIVSKKVYFHFK